MFKSNNYKTTLNSVFLISIIALSGCSAKHYMYSNEHDISLGENVTAKAISVDAKQRIIFTRGNKEGSNGLFHSICAEPSPDALSAIVSGVTIGATTSKTVLNAALSNAETAASIGLRTQSIQLLRDGMYRICEAAYSGSIDKDEVNILLKRYQDTMVAILAIESLTGAVQANQVILKGKSTASLGSNIDKASELYSKSLSDEQKAKAELDSATETANNKSQEMEAAKQTRADKLDTLGEDNKDSCEDEAARAALSDPVKTNCEAYLKANNDFIAAEKAHQDAETAKKTANDKHEVAQKTVAAQKKLFDSAITAGESSAETDGTFTQATSTSPISDQSAEHISKAIVDIVSQSLLRGEVIDQCLRVAGKTLETELDTTKSNTEKQLFLNKLNTMKDSLACDAILKAYATRFAGNGS